MLTFENTKHSGVEKIKEKLMVSSVTSYLHDSRPIASPSP